MKVVIAGGGTGGHLFPGIAIAEELKGRDAGTEILFVGTERGIEARVLPRLGWPVSFISAEGIKGKGVIARIRAVSKLIPGFFESLRIIKRFKPDVAVGIGGYASAPLLVAARLIGIRTAIHEQNALPGVANRILGKLADRVFVSFPDSSRFFPAEKVVVAGNPLRTELLEGLKGLGGKGQGMEERQGTVLICGGSLGAHMINMVALEMIRFLPSPQPSPSGRGSKGEGGLRIVHQTGEKDIEDIRRGYKKAGWDADVNPFIDDMAKAYTEADLVICRAGATTIAELAAAGRPAILIPYPFAADDHQRVNAESLIEAGAAIMILERYLTAEGLASEVKRLLGDKELLSRMGENARRLARIDAAKVIVDGIYKLIGR